MEKREFVHFIAFNDTILLLSHVFSPSNPWIWKCSKPIYFSMVIVSICAQYMFNKTN